MASQSVEQRRCVSCHRWGGWRRPGQEAGMVEFDAANDQGLCQEGPWHGSLRSSRSACGRWIQWLVLEGPGE